MIASFRDKETERLWQTGKSRRLPADLQRRAFKKLAILNAALALDNLKVPSGNQLEALRGNPPGSTASGLTINIEFVSCGGAGMPLR
jgi:proteic killer suppression protein